MFFKTFSLLPFHAGSPVSLFFCVLSPSSLYFLGRFSLLPKPFLSPLVIPIFSKIDIQNGWTNQPKIEIQNVLKNPPYFNPTITRVSKKDFQSDCRVKIKFERLNGGFVLSLIQSRF